MVDNFAGYTQVEISQAMPENLAGGTTAKPAKKRLWMRTGIYKSGGSQYCRFYWGKGHETFGFVHISGGSADSEAVKARRAAIDRMIADGAPLQAIFDRLRSFPNEQAGRKKSQ